ncbi:hypothetical protein A9X06_14990 [Mycobacterium sp. 852002-51759_SCH5129042]|nr:hypothetical protein A9X06_14990 [Mycobacterium sp. 852002-51759_SCH5129042]
MPEFGDSSQPVFEAAFGVDEHALIAKEVDGAVDLGAGQPVGVAADLLTSDCLAGTAVEVAKNYL